MYTLPEILMLWVYDRMEAPCAQEGSPEFFSYALCQVPFNLVEFMYGEVLEDHSKSAAKNF